MKNLKLFVAILLVFVLLLTAVACEVTKEKGGKIELGLADGVSLVLNVGEKDVDFTKFFKITDDGKNVAVTTDMLDLTKVDLTKEGSFNVTLSYGGKDYTVAFLVVASQESEEPELGLADGVSLELTVGESGVDFTKFFRITVDGKDVEVTLDMLDLSNVDLTKEGTFDVTLSYAGLHYTATFTVVKAGGDDPVVDPTDIKSILKSYEDVSKWNFVVNLAVSYDGILEYEEEFSQLGNILRYAHLNEYDETDTTVYVDYVKYLSDDYYIHYGDLGGGLYQMTTIDEEYYGYIYFPMLYVNYLSACDFKAVGNHYEALDPQECGDSVYGYADGCTYTKVELYVEDGKITKIVFFSDEEYYGDIYKGEAVFELSGYGTVDFDITNLEIVYGDTDGNSDELKEIFAKYEDDSTWNFGIDISVKINGTIAGSMIVAYDGWNSYLKQAYEGVLCTDYMVYDEASDLFWYLLDNADGTHTKYTEEDLMFYFLYSYMSPLAIYDLGNHVFIKVGDHYEAKYPEVAGDSLYGADETCVYTKVELYVEGGRLSKIVFFADIEGYDEDDNYVSYKEETIFEFGAYGNVSIDISGLNIIEDDGGDYPLPDDPVENPAELQAILDRLADMENWNFAITVEDIRNGSTYTDYYEYFKYLAMNKWEDKYGNVYLEYLSYDPLTFTFTLWLVDDDGSYFQVSDDEYDYYECIDYYYFADLSILSFFEFEDCGGFYSAKDPDAVGGYFIGYYGDASYTMFIITTANGNLKTIEATLDNGWTVRYTFSKYGEIELELPEEGGNGGNEEGDALTSTFVSADLTVGKGEMGYTSNVGANSLDPDRGLQFLQANGTAILTSKLSVNGVFSVTVVVNTNADNGMYVSVRVGNVYLTIDGETSVFVAKHKASENVTLTFTSDVALSGKVEVVLTTTQTKQSMYLKTISISAEDNGDVDDPNPNPTPDELKEILDSLADMNNWNFAVSLEVIDGKDSFDDYYEYFKQLAVCKYQDYYYGSMVIDYLSYDPTTNKYCLWLMDEDGSYFQISEDDADFFDYYFDYYFVDFSYLYSFEFEKIGGVYSAKNPHNAGATLVGEFEDAYWTSFTITIANGKLKAMELVLDDGFTLRFTFSKHGEIELKLPENSGNDDSDVGGETTLTSTFIGSNLAVGSGEIEYTSNVGANSLDENRGLQFMQGNGDAVLTSKVSISGIYSIELVVNTNADNGMNVSVKVGGVSLTSNGQSSIFVAKHAYTENVNLTFTSSVALSGKVEVTLSTTQTKQSMYIKSITIVRVAGGEGENPNPNPNPNVMESQNYDPNTFDHDNLQDKLMKEEGCIGLPSEGDINVLVVPVQFAGDTISAKDLEKLNIAFNGSETQTGWESVKTFYSKSSYGKLNLTFDIQDVFKAPNNARYYENYSKTVGSGSNRYTEYGDTLILTQVLAYLEPILDLTKYDSNDDGVIDAVYLIYSAPVDYESDDGLFWAFTTWYFGENQYDGLDAYYYLFAGFDFMDEDYGTNGMKVNAETYIHETGHLLGLDDYYDYDYSQGCNFGLGGADMMDFNHGDHGAFSKIMLGWTDATIVNSSVTLTIGNLVSTGDCILIPLNFDNSYFSEYLLIDLYSSSSLNQYASEALYDGASYGVRIYHVTAWANDPFNNDYGSFTDFNNTDSEFALIRLIEADGEYNFNSSNGDASASDLWQAGDSLSKVFSTFTRNDGKKVNFDITINSVSKDEASITITFID